MPRPPRPCTYEAEIARAARLFLRGTQHATPHDAIQAGARTEEQWTAILEGAHARFWSRNGLRARQAVRKRHPMKPGAAEVQVDPL